MTTGVETTWYTPGPWLAAAGPAAFVVADIAAEAPLLAAWAEAAGAGAGIDMLLAALTDHGIEAVGGFAMAEPRADGVRVVVRNPASAVRRDGVPVFVDPGVGWIDTVVGSDALPLRLGGDGAPTASVRLPIGRGVVLASSVDLYATASAAAPPLPPAPPAPPAPASPPLPPTATVQAAPSWPTVPGSPATPAVRVPPADPAVPADRAVAADLSDLSGAAASPPIAESDYSHLFGATVHPRPVAEQDPATTSPLASPLVTPAATTATSQDTLAGRPDLDPGPAVEPAVSGPGGLIDALPWDHSAVAEPPVGAGSPPRPAARPDAWAPAAAAPPLEPATVTPPSPVVDEASEHTVNRAALRVAQGPTVLAAYCPSGHLSPLHAQLCRVCGQSMPPNPPALTIPRPPLGVLRLPGGDTVTLDRGVVLGRAPSAGEDAQGERPHAVAVASPDKDVSRNHMEIRLEGWHVFAVDLGSTNGTVVVLPGRPPVRLNPTEPVMLERGATITLADEVTIGFEVPA